ncbi:MAG: sigma factor-like helix-turn-helix DNA-binding protein [Gammaproteobacteria bacterium]
MAFDASTPSATGAVVFTADFLINLRSYQTAIRKQRVARWARQRGLEEDLVQLALLDLARIDARFDPSRGKSAHHYRLAVLPSRVSDCVDALKRLHPDFVSLNEECANADVDDEYPATHQAESAATCHGDPVFTLAVREETATALRAAIAALPKVQRRIIEFVLADYTDREIAANLGVSIQAVCNARVKGTSALRSAVPQSHTLN